MIQTLFCTVWYVRFWKHWKKQLSEFRFIEWCVTYVEFWNGRHLCRFMCVTNKIQNCVEFIVKNKLNLKKKINAHVFYSLFWFLVFQKNKNKKQKKILATLQQIILLKVQNIKSSSVARKYTIQFPCAGRYKEKSISLFRWVRYGKKLVYSIFLVFFFHNFLTYFLSHWQKTTIQKLLVQNT